MYYYVRRFRHKIELLARGFFKILNIIVIYLNIVPKFLNEEKMNLNETYR